MKLESFTEKLRNRKIKRKTDYGFRCDGCKQWKPAEDRVKNPKSKMCKRCENDAQAVREGRHPVTELSK